MKNFPGVSDYEEDRSNYYAYLTAVTISLVMFLLFFFSVFVLFRFDLAVSFRFVLVLFRKVQ